MRRALVVARRTFRAPQCLRTCIERLCCLPSERGFSRDAQDGSSAAVARDATAEAVTEATEAVTEAAEAGEATEAGEPQEEPGEEAEPQ